jgi:hypothetical protein
MPNRLNPLAFLLGILVEALWVLVVPTVLLALVGSVTGYVGVVESAVCLAVGGPIAILTRGRVLPRDYLRGPSAAPRRGSAGDGESSGHGE